MKINAITKLMVIVIFLFISSNVQHDIAQDTQSAKHANSLLWEISGNDLTKPSYLFGTVHIIDSANYFLDEIVIEKLKCVIKLLLK